MDEFGWVIADGMIGNMVRAKNINSDMKDYFFAGTH